jgi:hypothetical protein
MCFASDTNGIAAISYVIGFLTLFLCFFRIKILIINVMEKEI